MKKIKYISVSAVLLFLAVFWSHLELGTIPKEARSIASYDSGYYEAPINVLLPPKKDMRSVFDKIAGFSAENVDIASNILVRMFARMNYNTPNANTIIFSVSLFKTFEALKVQTVNRDQLDFLSSKFKTVLPKDQYQLLAKIMKKIETIQFYRSKDGKVVVKITNVGNAKIVLRANDIPAEGQARLMVNQYFNSFEIENGTYMVFTDTKLVKEMMYLPKNKKLSEIEVQSFATPSSVTINGMKVSGKYDVIGDVEVRPEQVFTDIDNKIPARVKVSIKKGFLNPSWTFDMNN